MKRILIVLVVLMLVACKRPEPPIEPTVTPRFIEPEKPTPGPAPPIEEPEPEPTEEPDEQEAEQASFDVGWVWGWLYLRQRACPDVGCAVVGGIAPGTVWEADTVRTSESGDTWIEYGDGWAALNVGGVQYVEYIE